MNAKESATEIVSMLNTFGFDYKGVCTELRKKHPTLQQSFTRLCVEWLRKCAEDDPDTFDGRNEATHQLAKEVYPILQKTSIPFI